MAKQSTISSSVSCEGIGVHSGKVICMMIEPAPTNHGIAFIRSDISDRDNKIAANYKNVTDATMCTVISNEDGVSVATIEHLMSALWGCAIDNAIVTVNGPEIPIMDGSSSDFVELIESAGIYHQSDDRKFIKVIRPLKINTDDGKVIEILPCDDFSVELDIEFPHDSIGKQSFVFEENDGNYSQDVSKARTFGFLKDVEFLKSKGLAKGASLSNAIGIAESGILNPEGLRYIDEFVRHKVLDCIGDLYLACMRIKGKVKAFKSGHALNNLMLREIFSDLNNYKIVS